MDLQKKEADRRKKLQLLFLIITCMAPFFTVLINSLFPGVGSFLTMEYMTVPVLFFVGSALTQELTSSAKKCLLLSVIAVFWFVVIQLKHNIDNMGIRNFGMFAAAYLLAFPFAAVADDGDQNIGLKWVGRIYMAFSGLMVILLLALQLDILPEWLQAKVYWDGTRARIFWHPNGTACALMQGISFSMFALTRPQKKWKKWVLLALTALQFYGIVMTNSRTTIFITCALLAGTVFFVVSKKKQVRIPKAAAAILAVMVILLLAYNGLSNLHMKMQIQKLMTQQTEQTQYPGENRQSLVIDEETGEISIVGANNSVQGDLREDAKTLNGRTIIWAAAFETLRDNPDLKIWGTEYSFAELSYRTGWEVINSHNSWIQMLLVFGIPGLLIALVYTVIAVWSLCRILFRREEDIMKKIVAMNVGCILAASILEVYLFVSDDFSNCENFLFFLCTGYLVQWNRKASETE